ncbi:hypothetical protein BaRGS_00002448 [Batillaria attramentaria]|uniref:Uncharacterized protein n=1 Tax=Batillaria attramentaria TaxID=370345 RepID=A0ABD0M3J7_9CAEN
MLRGSWAETRRLGGVRRRWRQGCRGARGENWRAIGVRDPLKPQDLAGMERKPQVIVRCAFSIRVASKQSRTLCLTCPTGCCCLSPLPTGPRLEEQIARPKPVTLPDPGLASSLWKVLCQRLFKEEMCNGPQEDVFITQVFLREQF